MFKSYFKLGYRNLSKRKFYSLINILGLSVGITFCLLIGVFIWGELTVDQKLKDVDRLYILHREFKDNSMNFPILVYPPVAKAIKEEYPHLVENYYRWWDRNITVTKGEHKFRESTIIGDPSLLDMFGFKVLFGDRKNPLEGLQSIVVTKKTAIKYFGEANVVGENLELDTEGGGKQIHKITAVLDDLPRNSVSNLVDMDAGVFLPVSNIKSYGSSTTVIDAWDQMYLISYIKLVPGASIENVKKAFETLVKKHAPEQDIEKQVKIVPQPLTNYYLKDNKEARLKLVYTLSAIIIFILLMAIINFVNISIGTSSERIKEIGIRKAIGGVKKQLIVQFLTESIIVTFIASILSLFLYQLIKPIFTDVFGKSISGISELGVGFFVLFFFLFLTIALLAGIYPAFVLSSFNSIESLKGKIKTGSRGIIFRRSLITFQFTIALFVFLSTIIIEKQVGYFFNKDLGYEKSSVLTISSVPRDFTPKGVQKAETARDELKRLPFIKESSLSWVIPNGNYGGNSNFYMEGKTSGEVVPVALLVVDENFSDTYGLRLKQGKFFQEKGEEWQEGRVVFNEAAVKALNLKNPVGNTVKIDDTPISFKVTGVVEDFNFFSLHQAVKPMAFIHVKNFSTYRYISLKLKSKDIGQSLASIQKKWQKVFPDAPFEYSFMDQKLEELYKSELSLRKASKMATYLSLIIVVIGVLGMISLSLSKRTKEIGVRKVLGASIGQINILFLKEFVLLILLGTLISWPVAYLVLTHWLENFAYRIELTIEDFAWVSTLLLMLTGVIIVIQTSRTALLNPVKSLRNE
jgi:putative ABC transport system permease protein